MGTVTLSKLLRQKLSSWKRNGEHLPLTRTDAKNLLLSKRRVSRRGCWLWQGNRFGNGYGRLCCSWARAINLGARVHIVAYNLWRSAVPRGIFVCHSCDVKNCFNPKHLWLGTNQQNQLDASRKGVFNRYWTPIQRAKYSVMYTGSGNPMHGRTGKNAPAYGRIGAKHPMYGKHHTEAAREKISASLTAYNKRIQQ